MRAGALRQALSVEVLTTSKDSTGDPVETWTAVATVRGLVQPATGTETMVADQLRTEISHGITVRHPGFRINPGMHRIRMQGRVFNIVQARNIDERDREWRLTAMEFVAAGES